VSVFDNLIDQSETVAILRSAVSAAKNGDDESQDMTHAWLFTGPPGSGRSNAASAFAAALICNESGCNHCLDCATAIKGGHADVELLRTEGLSIKIEEIRELITRSSWTPAVAQYRVVIIEDADRLTESAGNALLKAIEEPGLRTVWLLCAPTLTDVLPTIRSRCRNITLRTPSTKAVASLLEKEGVLASTAELVARASQGHIGRARYLANNPEARSRRTDILKLPLTITDMASAFKCAQLLVDAAKRDAEAESEKRNDAESAILKEAWGQQGSRMVQGGSKALKELEKDQKSRQTRMVRDYLDRALLDIATFYRDVLLLQSGSKSSDGLINSDMFRELQIVASDTRAEKTLGKLEAIMKARTSLSRNSAPLLTVEAMMVQLR
jgi:DNA polymerase-3 subunit delta'